MWWSISSRAERRALRAFLLVAAAAPLALSCSQNPAPAPAGQPEAAAPAVAADAPATAPAAAAPEPRKGPEPPDGVWLTDDEGRQYFVEKLEKKAPHMRLEGNQVRTRWGITIEVAEEDDEFFYYKIYRPVAAAQEEPNPWTAKPSAEDEAKVRESYAVRIAESKRLSFAPINQGLPTGGQWRNGFDIADMNGDGNPDIVHGPARKSLGRPAIFLGDGKGGWRTWSEAKYPPLPYDYGDAAAADLNGDGHMDLALGMHLRGLVALIGDGKGGFTNWSQGLDLHVARSNDPKGGAGFSSRAIDVVDWNGDRRPDILALGEGPRLNLSSGRGEGQPPGNTESFGTVIYLNQGDGTWVRKDQGTASGQVFGDAVTVGDFNGDKRQDFATGSNVMGLRSLVNFSRQDGGWDQTDLELVRPKGYIRSVSAGDFDRDGRDDLAIGFVSFELATWRTGLDVLFARPDGQWERRALVAVESRDSVSALGNGDLDGDGHLDLVALTGVGETWVFLGDGKGGFTREDTEIPAVDGGCRGYHVEVADLDRDGRAEFVAGFAGENSPMFAPDLCRSGGALQAWDPVKAGDRTAAGNKNGSAP